MLTYPVVDPVGYSSRGGDCRHRGALPVPLFVFRQNENPARESTACGGAPGRGFGNPLGVPPSVDGYVLLRAPRRKYTGAEKVPHGTSGAHLRRSFDQSSSASRFTARRIRDPF